MRFLMLMIPTARAEAGEMPDAEAIGAMMKFNQDLAEAGALIALDGLHPSSEGARVSFRGGKPVVTDGPFTEAKEVIGGYWIIQVASRDEAVAWASRAPCGDGETIEVRRIFELEDFPQESIAPNADAIAAVEAALPKP
jgi:hypothetical protein